MKRINKFLTFCLFISLVSLLEAVGEVPDIHRNGDITVISITARTNLWYFNKALLEGGLSVFSGLLAVTGGIRLVSELVQLGKACKEKQLSSLWRRSLCCCSGFALFTTIAGLSSWMLARSFYNDFKLSQEREVRFLNR